MLVSEEYIDSIRHGVTIKVETRNSYLCPFEVDFVGSKAFLQSCFPHFQTFSEVPFGNVVEVLYRAPLHTPSVVQIVFFHET